MLQTLFPFLAGGWAQRASAGAVPSDERCTMSGDSQPIQFPLPTLPELARSCRRARWRAGCDQSERRAQAGVVLSRFFRSVSSTLPYRPQRRHDRQTLTDTERHRHDTLTQSFIHSFTHSHTPSLSTGVGSQCLEPDDRPSRSLFSFFPFSFPFPSIIIVTVVTVSIREPIRPSVIVFRSRRSRHERRPRRVWWVDRARQ